jgi:hypothetical protein
MRLFESLFHVFSSVSPNLGDANREDFNARFVIRQRDHIGDCQNNGLHAQGQTGPSQVLERGIGAVGPVVRNQYF